MGAYNRGQDTKAGKVRKEARKRQETRKEDDTEGAKVPQAVLSLGSSGWVSAVRPGNQPGRKHRGKSIQTHQIRKEAGERQEARKEADAHSGDAAPNALQPVISSGWAFGPADSGTRRERGWDIETGKVGKETGKRQEAREQDHLVGEDAQESFLKFDFPSWVLRPAGGLK
jgi:hypothetical protein